MSKHSFKVLSAAWESRKRHSEEEPTDTLKLAAVLPGITQPKLRYKLSELSCTVFAYLVLLYVNPQAEGKGRKVVAHKRESNFITDKGKH